MELDIFALTMPGDIFWMLARYRGEEGVTHSDELSTVNWKEGRRRLVTCHVIDWESRHFLPSIDL